MNTLSSIPGALLFRSVMAVILLLILIVSFLSYTSDLTQKAEQIERDKIIYELDMALSFRLFSATIEGKLGDLPALNHQNPFVVLADENYSAPRSYVGEVKQPYPLQKSGWYFDTGERVIFYWDMKKIAHRFRLQFNFTDINRSGQYETNVDVIEWLGMVGQ